jgi:hypothetical protein
LNKPKSESTRAFVDERPKSKSSSRSRERRANDSTREWQFIKKQPPKSFAEVQQNLWKNNIMFTPRKRKDVLDISNEDFSKVFVTSFDGEKINPSTFNIFRDSLRETSKKL